MWKCQDMIDKEYLYELYIQQNKRRTEICQILGISTGMVDYYLRKYSIRKPQELQNKLRKETSIQKYGSKISVNWEKAKKTYVEKYGVDNPGKSKQCQEKAKQTNLKKYGNEHFSNTKQFKQQMKDNYNIYQQKQNTTKTKNKSYNTSKIEDKIYELLKQKFGEQNIKRNYFCKEYPWKCDFYIQSKNLYIEYQGMWTHGNMPYTNLEECLLQLEKWIEKSKQSNFYKNAIHTWTELDVRKRNWAKNKNLNWIEFFSFKEFSIWIESI